MTTTKDQIIDHFRCVFYPFHEEYYQCDLCERRWHLDAGESDAMVASEMLRSGWQVEASQLVCPSCSMKGGAS